MKTKQYRMHGKQVSVSHCVERREKRVSCKRGDVRVRVSVGKESKEGL